MNETLNIVQKGAENHGPLEVRMAPETSSLTFGAAYSPVRAESECQQICQQKEVEEHERVVSDYARFVLADPRKPLYYQADLSAKALLREPGRSEEHTSELQSP